MDSNLRLFVSKHANPVYEDNYGQGELFGQKSDIFFWCTLLGYKASPDKIPPKISVRKGEIQWGAFDEDIQQPIMKMIAVKAKDSFEILKKNSETGGQQEFRDILQAYAELGFSVLQTQLGNKFEREDLVEVLIDYKFNTDS